MEYKDWNKTTSVEEKDGSWTVHLLELWPSSWKSLDKEDLHAPRYWFKPMEKRVEIATRRLWERDRKRTERKRLEERLSDISRGLVGRP